MPNRQNPVVVVPGITGSTLVDRYPLDHEELWTALLHKEHERVSLHPDDRRYEAQEPALVRAGELLDLGYRSLVLALRHDLTVRADWPTPVFPFPYDWRQPVEKTAESLAGFIEEVLARTKLLRHYRESAHALQVDVVAHSMGGLVTAEYVGKFGDRRRLERVATLGAPYRGSVEVLVKLLTGMGNLAGEMPEEREREAARSMPAVYQLLPSFEGAVLAEGSGEDVSELLYRMEGWQQGVFQSLAEYIRLHAVDPGNEATRRIRAESLLQDFLDVGMDHRARMEALDISTGGLSPADWLVIVGVGAKTRVRVRLGEYRGKPRYRILDKDFVDQFSDDRTSTETGDSTVPLLGAIPSFVPGEQIVAVTPSDEAERTLRSREEHRREPSARGRIRTLDHDRSRGV